MLTNTPRYFTDRNVPSECVFKCTHQNWIHTLKTCQNSEFVYIHISGHGYQTHDRTNNELDGRSEYVVLQSGMLSDNDIYTSLKNYIRRDCKIRMTIDTCHSGTMSNFNYSLNANGQKTNAVKHVCPHFTNAYSLSACSDNQYSSNDIGYTCGFGGSLTVHMIDTHALTHFLFDETSNLHTCLKLIECVLSKLKQKPLLLTDN
jgi:hypothetical protein